MKNTTKISCCIGTTNANIDLGMEIWLDGVKLFDQVINKTLDFVCEVDEQQADHELTFVMKNKLASHTILDSQGAIVEDARLSVGAIAFEGIDITQMFMEQAIYAHNFNGTGDSIKDKFFGEMGCNGQVTLHFSTPVYLWLLENM